MTFVHTLSSTPVPLHRRHDLGPLDLLQGPLEGLDLALPGLDRGLQVLDALDCQCMRAGGEGG